MKYGESFFDIIYLLFVLIIGFKVLSTGKNKSSKLMGISILLLGFGDAFHLVPRVLAYFINKDFNLYLGIGKLITSITMTIFYIFSYYIYLKNYKTEENKTITMVIWLLSIIRIALCLFPQNSWFTNESPYLWGIIRNIPFAIQGFIIAILYFKNRKEDQTFKNIWLFICLSFIFYLVVVLGASFVKMLGMFMIPKTICYIIMVAMYNKKSQE